MKRSTSASENGAANKSRKLEEDARRLKKLRFQDQEVDVVIDSGGGIWFSYADVTRALDIPSIPSKVYDFCVREKFVQQFSELCVREYSTLLPATAFLISPEGVHQIELSSGRPKERQFIESVLERLNAFSTALVAAPEIGPAQNDEEGNRYVDEVERLRRENARQKEELARRDEEKRQADKKLEKYRNAVYNLKSREPTQVVYIATCERYARQNMFKVGGVKSMDLLRGRLAVCNTGRTPSDFLYYCFWVKCSNHRRLEQRVADVVGEHRAKKEAEMYNLHFSALREVVEYLSERFNEEEEKYKGMFESLIRETLENEPEVPSPWLIGGVEYRNAKQDERNATNVDQKINFDSLVKDEQYSLVIGSLDEYIKNMLPPGASTGADSAGLSRRNFESYMTTLGIKFGKRNMWRILKVVARSRNVSFKY